MLFLEKLSPALEQVDSSSGAIGTATCNAIETLVPFIARAPADDERHDDWLKRLWQALQDDGFDFAKRRRRRCRAIVEEKERQRESKAVPAPTMRRRFLHF